VPVEKEFKMSPVVKEELLKYVDRDLYDMKGFVDYQKLTARLGIKAVKLARAAGKMDAVIRYLEDIPKGSLT
jgi:hypothetical protein